MPHINILDENTINKIAAGEVVEKPMAVVKELVENSIDAGSDHITIEIKEGGISFIRVTDNGCGINSEDINNAFERHATSKISDINDLNTLSTLGFRGEALASISAVSELECITKSEASFTGIHYSVTGGKGGTIKEIGCPNGTTFVIRNLFYNVPARKKFLKTAATEASYITDLVEKLALSHPDIAFNYIVNGQSRLATKGNGNLLDVIYNVYGRDITGNVTELSIDTDIITAHGFIGKPVVSRGSRAYMTCFINGRYIKSNILYRAIEEAYGGYKMKHRFPFAVISINIDSSKMDVNVHPSKMEIRFDEPDRIYSLICNTIRNTLRETDIIPQIMPADKKEKENLPKQKEIIPEPFERNRIKQEPVYENQMPKKIMQAKETVPYKVSAVQDTLFSMDEMKKEEQKNFIVCGCVFSTYWIIEYNDEMYIMDQHAAHEKVMYEKYMKSINLGSVARQQLSPPLIITLSAEESQIVNSHYDEFYRLGFEISDFGGNEYAISCIPAELPGISSENVLIDVLTSLSKEKDIEDAPGIFYEKVASMACKSAVKGGRRITETEAYKLVCDLFTLDNPFCCPHGRPTIIKTKKSELEKQFGRIV